MSLLVIIAVGSWEFYLRQKNISVSYDEGAELWADKRALADGHPDQRTVFIGASRIKYDLDTKTWKDITGKEAVQLAIEGNSPLKILEDLGNDPKFKGHVVVDATEEFYFSLDPAFNTKPGDHIHYYEKQTYAQKASFQINHLLQSQFVFLNSESLSLKVMMDKLMIPNRPGVYMPPTFPQSFEYVNFDRQDRMKPEFVADTILQNQVTGVWKMFFGKLFEGAAASSKSDRPKVLKISKKAVDQIRARGGDVVFVRVPSTGPFWEKEQVFYKRSQFWNPLLTATHAKGVYFTDYPTISHFKCVEWSHLSQPDAVAFTTELIKLLPPSFVK